MVLLAFNPAPKIVSQPPSRWFENCITEESRALPSSVHLLATGTAPDDPEPPLGRLPMREGSPSGPVTKRSTVCGPLWEGVLSPLELPVRIPCGL